jgi:elongation factor G
MQNPAPFIVQAAVLLNSETDRAKLDRVMEELTENDNRLAVVEGVPGQLTRVRATSLDLLSAAADALASEVKVLPPSVIFCRTLTRAARIHYTHKKANADGTGEFADVAIAFEPLPRGTGEMFANDLAFPITDQFVRAIGAGLAAAAETGVRFIDFKARLIDAKYHERDSTPDAFELAARGAFHELRTSNPELVFVEPVMWVEVLVPDEFFGRAIVDLKTRRGQLQETGRRDDGTMIAKALVPLANLIDYGATQHVFSEYRASVSMRFAHFEPVPDEPGHDDDDPRFPGAMGARVA